MAPEPLESDDDGAGNWHPSHGITLWTSFMQTVVLYGNSLVVSTFGANLENQPGLRLLRVDPTESDANQRLSEIRPDIVIFDLTIERTDFAISLWKSQPDLLLIGVTPDRSEMLILSGQKQRVLCLEDLLAIIQGGQLRIKTKTSEIFQGEKHEKKN
jgi:hypothetical protein